MARTCYNRGVEDVLLIAADRQFRRLAYAQLLEEGYSVLALPSLETALATCSAAARRHGWRCSTYTGRMSPAGKLATCRN